jgi:DNA helicase-2/ATP-dependent DNA helicase PcrA
MHESFNNFITNNLNPAQQKAVLHEAGSVLVVAGAGSGKTRVITARITHLIVNKNVPASSIVALTFTNKAAHEMKERIASFLDNHADLPFVGTFHAYCVQLLKKYNAHLPIPFVSIIDSDDQQKMIQGILQRNNVHKQFTAKSVAHHISQMKNHAVDASSNTSDYLPHPMLTEIFNAYEAEKRASKCLDFDDLLLETLKLLKNNTVIKQQFQNRVRHILVDEYQDTNVVQHELLKIMALLNKELAIDSVCAVGDEDQSIYSWRGATVANMAHFKNVFPNTTIITIEQNYRSVQPILHLANNAIQNNTHRTPKNLWSEKQGQNRIHYIVCLTEYQEAKAIAQLLLNAKQKYGLNNVGILYRTHTQSRAIEEALLKESIPYRIIGGIQFYERKEIKDLIAYLRIIANPFDKISFFRIINVPARGLGDKFEQDFYTAWNNEPFATWHDILKHYIASQSLGKVKITALEKFMSIVHDIQLTNLTSAALELIITRAQYIDYVKNNNDPIEAQARLDNIKELLAAVTYFEKNGTTTITAFLDEVALMQEMMNKQNRDTHAVSLMTLHAAKGLEFSLVILPGLEEGIIPTTRSINLNETLEEERRLFYVGITRAKEHLIIMQTKHRYSYGQMVDQYPSRFLQEVQKLIPQEDFSYTSLTHVYNFFAQWLNVGKKTLSDVFVPTSKVSFIKKSSLEKAEPVVANNKSSWRKNQPVKHEKYGIGTIQEIEEKNAETTYLTVRFKASIKKILAQFLQRL